MSDVYLGPGIGHPHDSLRIRTWVNKVVEARDVTWETLPVMVVLPVQLQEPALSELGEAPTLGGM